MFSCIIADLRPQAGNFETAVESHMSMRQHLRVPTLRFRKSLKKAISRMPDNFQYQATLTGAGTSTPVLTRVVATFAGTNTSSLISMVYDACGNLASLSRETASGTATEVRDNASWSATERINSLNQIKRNDVTPVGDRPPPIAILTMPTAPLPAKPTAPPPGPTPGILWAISAY